MKMSANVPNPYLVFRTVIVEAMKRGEIPHKDPDLANSMVMGAIVQVIDTKILGRIKTNLSAQTETVAKSCAAMLRS
jgi:hypothetical protein